MAPGTLRRHRKATDRPAITVTNLTTGAKKTYHPRLTLKRR
jgi:hypothetical protein